MLKEIKECIQNCPEKCISLLTKKTIAYNISEQDLKQILSITEANKKIHPKIAITVYSIMLMRKFQNYNPKAAIQTLSKYYNNNPEDKSRMVVAAMLLRIPNFTNYKLIIEDLHPKLVPVQLMLKHKQKMIKQCPNKYKQFVINRYKNQWIQLITEDSFVKIRSLDGDFKELRQKTQKVFTMNDSLQLYEMEQQLQKLCSYLTKRVQRMKKQEIFIHIIVEEIDKILSLNIQQQTQEVINQQVKKRMKKIVTFVQNYIYKFLGDFCKKIKSLLFRQLRWYIEILQKGLIGLKSGIMLKSTIYLMKSMYIAFGEGGIDIEIYLYDQPYSIEKLMQSLLYNNYTQTQEKINYQKKDKNKKNNTKINQISLYQANFYESHFENYLMRTDEKQREELLSQCLLLIFQYYDKSSNLKKASVFLDLLANCKNQLSRINKTLFLKFKDMLFKDKAKDVQNLQAFCEEVFENKKKKKLNKQLSFYSGQSINILPQPVIKKKQTNNTAEDLIKKTTSVFMFDGLQQSDHLSYKSFDIESSGWKTVKECKNSKDHFSSDQLFKNKGKEEVRGQNQELQNNKQDEELVILPDL